ncbi:DNA gyrase inhibitor YacG [Phenylobacterium sp.]|uniref:DNA gyrase inhibitor YacG n=1 Tax=Phenylobacterium sp. TaxID=1871053 RepID=UPI0011FFF55D|nr:DNA gyrase inhibitor YacG [Phenylobacterium sp.]THD62715.1 MAG: DNA gyrase inhibitor YacG [Phenylobacterium sp.]
MSAAKCPVCGRPAAPQHRPFCSPRCGDLDLHRWLSGGYVAPAAEEPDEPAEPSDED